MIWSWPQKAKQHAKVDLHEITICAIDSVTPHLAARALRKSVAACRFGEAILFTDKPFNDSSFETVKIDNLKSRDDYSQFVLKKLVNYIHTPFVLIIQWDGYIVESNAWRDDFLNYDLIGARWHWHKDGMTVGNGGFTLRSRELLGLLANEEFTFIPNWPEDDLICRTFRPRLTKEYGIKFAPENVADLFSYERIVPEAPTFGFHGLFNMWRHVPDEEMIEMLDQFSPHLFKSREFYELLAQYVQLRKFDVIRGLFARLTQYATSDQIRDNMTKYLGGLDVAQRYHDICLKANSALKKE